MTSSLSALARTPLHHWHAAHKAHFEDRDRWQVVVRYAEVAAEIAKVRSGLGIADISVFEKLSLLGRGVPEAAQRLLAPSGATSVRGVAPLAADASVLGCRLTDDHLLLLAATPKPTLAQHLANLPPYPSIISSDVTSAYASFYLLGVPLEDMLRRLTPLDVAASLPVGACTETSFAGVPALLVRAAEFGLPSVRLYVAWDLGEDVWQRLLDAGRPWELTAVGLDCLGQLRGTGVSVTFVGS